MSAFAWITFKSRWLSKQHLYHRSNTIDYGPNMKENFSDRFIDYYSSASSPVNKQPVVECYVSNGNNDTNIPMDSTRPMNYHQVDPLLSKSNYWDDPIKLPESAIVSLPLCVNAYFTLQDGERSLDDEHLFPVILCRQSRKQLSSTDREKFRITIRMSWFEVKYPVPHIVIRGTSRQTLDETGFVLMHVKIQLHLFQMMGSWQRVEVLTMALGRNRRRKRFAFSDSLIIMKVAYFR